MPPTTAKTASSPNHAGQSPVRMWLLAVLVFSASVGSLEAFSRSNGYRPTVPPNKDLWYFWRQRVYRDDGKVIVFLGTSRVMADISLDTLSDCLPDYRAIQLGLSGAVSCVDILKDLTDNPAFTGTIICELDTPLLERSLWGGHREYRDYRPPSMVTYCESIIQARLQDILIMLRNEFAIRPTLIRLVYAERVRRPDEIRTTFYGETQWEFDNIPNLESYRWNTTRMYRETYEVHKFADGQSLQDNIGAVDTLARSFQTRGGNIVFLRAPSSGDRWALEERYHSKRDAWDRFAAMTSAVCVHFQDVPEMRSFYCPDESHLDMHDSPRFTRALVNELVRRGAVRK